MEGNKQQKGLNPFVANITQKCFFFSLDSREAQRKVSPLLVSRFGQMSPLFGSSTEAGSCLHGAAHQNQGWWLPEMGSAGFWVWKGMEDPDKFLMRALGQVGTGAKGTRAPPGAGTGTSLAGGCCWKFLPSKETPVPGRALLLVQGGKTGSGERQFVSF